MSLMWMQICSHTNFDQLTALSCLVLRWQCFGAYFIDTHSHICNPKCLRWQIWQQLTFADVVYLNAVRKETVLSRDTKLSTRLVYSVANPPPPPPRCCTVGSAADDPFSVHSRCGTLSQQCPPSWLWSLCLPGKLHLWHRWHAWHLQVLPIQCC